MLSTASGRRAMRAPSVFDTDGLGGAPFWGGQFPAATLWALRCVDQSIAGADADRQRHRSGLWGAREQGDSRAGGGERWNFEAPVQNVVRNAFKCAITVREFGAD